LRRSLVIAALLLPITLAGCAHPAPYYPPPPGVLSQIAQQGFRDGAAAARRDIATGLRPDAARHPRFRRPPVPPPTIADYRQGFRSGYEQMFRNEPPPPPPPAI
jgi:hypothetical protein